MGKLTRIVCLVTVLILTGLATAGAGQWSAEGYGYCYYSCGERAQTTFANCCGGWEYECASGWLGIPMSWKNGYGTEFYCPN